MSERSLANLRKLIGVPVMLLTGSQFFVREPLVLAWYFSIAIEDTRWMTCSCDWYETERERLDYWMLKVEENPLPPGISLDERRSLVGVSSIFVGAMSPIESIKTLRRTSSGHDEAVSYDHGILFTRQDGVEFCIAAEEAIANRLQYCREGAAIEEILSSCESRSIG